MLEFELLVVLDQHLVVLGKSNHLHLELVVLQLRLLVKRERSLVFLAPLLSRLLSVLPFLGEVLLEHLVRKEY